MNLICWVCCVNSGYRQINQKTISKLKVVEIRGEYSSSILTIRLKSCGRWGNLFNRIRDLFISRKKMVKSTHELE